MTSDLGRKVCSLLKHQRFDEILRLTRNVDLNPQDIETRVVLYARAISLVTKQQYDDSLMTFRLFLQYATEPTEAEYWINYLKIVQVREGGAQFESALKQALGYFPENEQLSITGASFCHTSGRPEDALDYLESIQSPMTGEWFAIYLRVQLDLRNFQLAFAFASKHWGQFQHHNGFAAAAIQTAAKNFDVTKTTDWMSAVEAQKNSNTQLINQCAKTYAAFGNTEKASRLYGRVMKKTQSIANIASTLDAWTNTDVNAAHPEVEKHIASILKNGSFGDKGNILFARAKCELHAKQYAKYVQTVITANTYRATHFKKHPLDYASIHKQAQSLQNFVEHTAITPVTLAPVVFVVGLPRCGSTLVADWISGNTDALNTEENSIIARHMHNALRSNTIECDVLQNSLAHLKYLTRLPKPMHFDLAPFKQLIIDKTLSNYLYLGLIHQLFPQARIVWIRRDPEQHAWAMFRQNFHHAYQQFTFTPESILTQVRLEKDMMEFWRSRKIPFKELHLSSFVESPITCMNTVLGDVINDYHRPHLQDEKRTRLSHTASKSQIRGDIRERTNYHLNFAKTELPALFSMH